MSHALMYVILSYILKFRYKELRQEHMSYLDRGPGEGKDHVERET